MDSFAITRAGFGEGVREFIDLIVYDYVKIVISYTIYVKVFLMTDVKRWKLIPLTIFSEINNGFARKWWMG